LLDVGAKSVHIGAEISDEKIAPHRLVAAPDASFLPSAQQQR
jgi:hypothetical protein